MKISPEVVLVIVAHPDDEVLGCGGTIAKWANEGRDMHLLIMADGESSRQLADTNFKLAEKIELRRNAVNISSAILGFMSIEHLSFPDNRMDTLSLLDVVRSIERSIFQIRPGKILTHHSGDVNIDHRVVHDAVIAASRPQPNFCVRELLFFETPSSTEWRPPSSLPAFSPNFFVDVTKTLDIKLEALKAYNAEMRDFPHARSYSAVQSLARWRGVTIGVEAAEAFVIGRKID